MTEGTACMRNSFATKSRLKSGFPISSTFTVGAREVSPGAEASARFSEGAHPERYLAGPTGTLPRYRAMPAQACPQTVGC
jgi:hypothetical protein